MNIKNKILILLISLIFASCNYSNEGSAQINYSSMGAKQNDTIKQKINGVDYTLVSQIEYKNVSSNGITNIQFENKISFQGLGKKIDKVITKLDLDKKIELDKDGQFNIEIKSFSVNENRDEIYLKYNLIQDNHNQSVTITLKKRGEIWDVI